MKSFTRALVIASVVTATACGLAVSLHAAPLAVGTIIGIDFGPTAPGNDYNQVISGMVGPDPNTIDGAYGPFIDLNGVAVDSVGLTIAGLTPAGFSNNDGTSHDLANYPAFLELADANTTDIIGKGIGGNMSSDVFWTVTWTGLDNSLLYKLYGISSVEAPAPDFGVTFSADNQSATANNTSTTGGTLAQLSGLQTDGAGNLVVTITALTPLGGPPATFVPLVNAMALEAAAAATGTPGDFDADGDVDGADFVAWQTNFPKATGATLAEGDADSDGDVDGADFVVWQTNFPFTPGPGASPVPEPNAVALAAFGAIAFVCQGCRRRRGE